MSLMFLSGELTVTNMAIEIHHFSIGDTSSNDSCSIVRQSVHTSVPIFNKGIFQGPPTMGPPLW